MMTTDFDKSASQYIVYGRHTTTQSVISVTKSLLYLPMEEKIREQARRGNRGTEQENRAGEKAGKKKREGG